MPSLLLGMSAAVLILAYLVITYFSRNIAVDTLHERIIFFIVKLALSFVVVFGALYFGLSSLEAHDIVPATASFKMLIQGMLIMAVALFGLAYINFQTVKRIRNKNK